MNLDIKKAWKELITALALVLDLEEGKVLYHSWRVAVVSTMLADEILPENKSDVFIAGLLHDVGAMSLHNHITRYPTLKEQVKNPIIRTHTIIGAQVVSDLPGFETSPSLILDHHEHWDGHGYPRAKQGEEITSGAQLIRAADTFDFLLRASSNKTPSEVIGRMEDMAEKEIRKSIFPSVKKTISNSEFFQDIKNIPRLRSLLFRLRDEISVKGIKERTDVMGIALSIFSQVIDAKHAYTLGHSRRVSKYGLLIAIGMNLPHDEVTKIKWAGLVHDIGKVAVPSSILDNSEALSEEEYALVKTHTIFTKEILETVSFMKDLAPIAAAHHERFDGNGYPRMLKGKEIPLGARILSVADTFDSLTSMRGYRSASTIPNAISEIKKNSQTQFDPDVVEAAVAIFQNF
jgi:putative nucleotidyltransferase with HDIG domain